MLLSALLRAHSARAQGFTDSFLASALSPTALASTPDGRLLLMSGEDKLLIYDQNGTLLSTALTLSTPCSNFGFALGVDPAFTTNGFIYLGHSFGSTSCSNRISRFTLPPSNVVDPASEVVLITIGPTAYQHNGLGLHFGNDGYLYVSTGDAACDVDEEGNCDTANDNARDLNRLIGKILRVTSTGGIPASNPFQGPGTAPCAATGQIAPGSKCQEILAWGLRNPRQLAFDMNDASVTNQRFFINDSGDSAGDSWEEIDLGQAGADYGWNCREGGHPNSQAGAECTPPPPNMVDPIFNYHHSQCALNGGAITGGSFVPSTVWFPPYNVSYLYADYDCGGISRLSPDGFGGYTTSPFLQVYDPVTMIFGPYGSTQALYYVTFMNNGELHRITYSGPGNQPPVAVPLAIPAAGAAPLTVTLDGRYSHDPDGDPISPLTWDFGDGSPRVSTTSNTVTHTYSSPGAYTATLVVTDSQGAISAPATVRIFAATPGDHPPVAVASSSPAAGVAPLVVVLDGSASSDPDPNGRVVGYLFDPGDGTPPVWTSSPTLTHVYSVGTFTATLVAEDNQFGLSAPASVRIVVTDGPPVPSITSPPAGTFFAVGRPVNLSGSAADPEDGVLPGSALSWTVLLHEGNQTFPIFGPVTGSTAQFTAPGPTSLQGAATGYLEVRLTATDSKGIARTVTESLLPHRVNVAFATSPPALTLGVNGLALLAPRAVVSWEAYSLSVAAADQVDPFGHGWTFASWSDGGAPSHVFTTPPTDAALVATFGPSPALGIGDSTVIQPPSGSATAAFTVALSSASTQTVSASYATVDGTATAGSDYAASSGTLLFPPGTLSQTVSVTVFGNPVLSGTKTFFVTLSGVSGAMVGRGSGRGLILDDQPGPRVEFSAANYTIGLGGLAVITVKRVGSASGTTTVDYSASDGTAVSGTDYMPASGTLSFGPGVVTRFIVVQTLADRAAKGTATVLLSLANPGTGSALADPTTAVLTIVGYPLPGALGFSQPVFTVGEPGLATISVNRVGGSAVSTVDYATTDGTATGGLDYVPTSGTLAFGAGIVSRTFTVATLDDGLIEMNKTVHLTLSNPTGGAVLGAASSSVLAIQENNPVFQFSLSNYTVPETAPQAMVTVARSGPLTEGFSVGYATSNGTALAGIDYVATSGTLFFGRGVSTQSFSVPVLPYRVDYPGKTVLLSLSSPSLGSAVGQQGTAVLTIQDAQAPGAAHFSLSRFTVSEKSKTVTIVVTRKGTAGGVTVDYATSDGSAVAGSNYTQTAGTLAFANGVTVRTFTIPILDSGVPSGDLTFNVTLLNPTGGATLAAPSQALVAILGDDPALQFNAPAYRVAENGLKALILVSRSGPLSVTQTVQYATSGGNPSDYTPTSGTLVFSPGVSVQGFYVPVTDTGLAKGNDAVDLTLTNPTGGAVLGPRSGAVLTIATDDPTLQFSQPNYVVTESTASARITVTLAGPVPEGNGTSTIVYSTSDGTAKAGQDYVAASGTLTFGPGVRSQTFVVPVLNEHRQDGGQTVILSLSNPTGPAILGGQSQSLLTITSVETAGKVQFSTPDFSVSGTSAAATIIVTRAGGTAAAVAIDYSTGDGTALAGTDYVPTSGTLIFGEGQTSQTFAIEILGGAGGTLNKTVTLALANPGGGASLGPQPTATLWIVANP
jgi:glucose/arabinose dehydrogenase/PKD repeat protein